MNYCPFVVSRIKSGYKHYCPKCHTIRTSISPRYIRVCPVDSSDNNAERNPGDYLHDAILKWVGEGPTRQCGCQDRIRQMNAWGPTCREHIEEITDWLMEEAAKRGWWKIAAMVPGSRYFIQRMVMGAIEKAEAAAVSLRT